MTSHITDQWLEAETALGFHAFYGLHIRGLQKLVVIQGPDSTVLQRIAQTYGERDVAMVRWHSIWNPAALTGVLLPRFETAWISAEIFRRLTVPPSVQVESLPAGPEAAFNPELAARQMRLKQCLAAAATALEEYELRAAGPEPDIESWICEWGARFLPRRTDGKPSDIHSFGAPLTADGPHLAFLSQTFAQLDSTLHLTHGLPHVNSRLIRRLGEFALMRGYTVHFYHNALHPSRIDHVVVPDLSLGVTGASAPHDVPGGRVRWDIDTAFGRSWTVPDADEWWRVYQKMYVQAWCLMQEIRDLQRVSDPAMSLDAQRFVSRFTA